MLDSVEIATIVAVDENNLKRTDLPARHMQHKSSRTQHDNCSYSRH